MESRKAQRAVRRKKFSWDVFVLATVLTATACAYASWIYHQPLGRYTVRDRAVHSSPVLLVPVIAFFLEKLYAWYLSLREKRDNMRLEHLKKTRQDMLKTLKDCTKYDRVYELLNKYDPEEQRKLMARLPNRNQGRQEDEVAVVFHRRTASTSGPVIPTTRNAGSPASASQSHLPPSGSSPPRESSKLMAAAQKTLLPVLDHFANSIIGDSPEVLDEIKRLREEVEMKEKLIASLRQENSQLQEALQPLQQTVSSDEDDMYIHQSEHQKTSFGGQDPLLGSDPQE